MFGYQNVRIIIQSYKAFRKQLGQIHADTHVFVISIANINILMQMFDACLQGPVLQFHKVNENESNCFSSITMCTQPCEYWPNAFNIAIVDPEITVILAHGSFFNQLLICFKFSDHMERDKGIFLLIDSISTNKQLSPFKLIEMIWRWFKSLLYI